ncbi:MAG: cytochrome C [Gammaproteobacteria bacterium]
MNPFNITLLAGLLSLGLATVAHADDFTEQDVAAWYEAYLSVVDDGRAAWTDADLGTNGVVCAQCHPNAANSHPETYPKFQKQLGRVAQLWEMVNWCIRNPLEGEDLAADDPRMTAILAYISHERRGVRLDPGRH